MKHKINANAIPLSSKDRDENYLCWSLEHSAGRRRGFRKDGEIGRPKAYPEKPKE